MFHHLGLSLLCRRGLLAARLLLATPHRVKGSTEERISAPLFFNPRFDTNVAPPGEPPIRAVDHLQKRFDETYLHLKRA